MSHDLIEKPVEGRRGHATVAGSESAQVMSLGETLGRRRGAKSRSQENCLIDNHRYYLRGMGRGFAVFLCHWVTL